MNYGILTLLILNFTFVLCLVTYLFLIKENKKTKTEKTVNMHKQQDKTMERINERKTQLMRDLPDITEGTYRVEYRGFFLTEFKVNNKEELVDMLVGKLESYHPALRKGTYTINKNSIKANLKEVY